jgi:hypothetical protein
MLVMRGQKDSHALRNWAVFMAVFLLGVATAAYTRGPLEALLDICLLAPAAGCIAEMHDAYAKGRGGFLSWQAAAAPILMPACVLAFVGCLLRVLREISPTGFAIALCTGLISLGVAVRSAQVLLASRIEKRA